jgi:Flp pilus assembly protein TadG
MLSYMKRKLAELRSCTSGNVLVLAGTGCFVLAGGVGLAVDTAQWYLWKRQLQQAVDSGALAAAHTLSQNGTNTYRTEGRDEITRNANGLTINVERLSNRPLVGGWFDDPGAVEVIATTTAALPFSGLFMDAGVTVRSRAVATAVARGENCIISLAGTGTGVTVQGTADVGAGCGVIANSTDDEAIRLVGSSYLDANPISAVGNITADPSNYPANTAILPYGVASEDPVAARNLSVPTVPAGCTQTNYRVAPSASRTISPGRYCGGMRVQGTVTMNPGVYIMDAGDFFVASSARVVGNGVTIILTGSSAGNVANVDIRGGSDVQLHAPTSAQDSTWQGMLFFQDPNLGNNGESKINGDSNLDLDGIVYMPNGDLTFNGSSGQYADCLFLVAERVTFGGEARLDNNCPIEYSDLDFQNYRIALVE